MQYYQYCSILDRLPTYLFRSGTPVVDIGSEEYNGEILHTVCNSTKEAEHQDSNLKPTVASDDICVFLAVLHVILCGSLEWKRIEEKFVSRVKI
ncbi:hypothetical protein AVEN_76332-1 [Araneus ventricosus]|uniref:Uncharacterized protein n=1 Tax=Araneus ventricosus TaxID=182803 RepID=A0A4Y2NUP1_ARAVE|nr:hypothetical protein AVEN_76332-1 [Araneus ventricosus]